MSKWQDNGQVCPRTKQNDANRFYTKTQSITFANDGLIYYFIYGLLFCFAVLFTPLTQNQTFTKAWLNSQDRRDRHGRGSKPTRVTLLYP